MTDMKRDNIVGGLVLIAVGLLAMASQTVDLATLPGLGWLILPLLAALFIVAGIVTRSAGPMIPGGSLAGISLGIYLLSGPFEWLGGTQSAGVFLLAFALGWASITVISAVFTHCTVWWTLFPAAALAVAGAALYAGGPALSILKSAGQLWPLALIACGAWAIYKTTSNEKSPDGLK